MPKVKAVSTHAPVHMKRASLAINKPALFISMPSRMLTHTGSTLKY